MSMVVNNNMMAANTARNLNAHYGRLATSTQRLSSGLRINSAADDAAGLAIRELQRADIAALHQGARNANDAISMIQVADGALGIIDEKLIRMKELAEQAATGTYDSTQRLMIESEYQAMASEITRIANATDFNGIKLLDGTLDGEHDGSGMTATGKMKIHFGTGNDSAEDYYYITIGECTAQAFGLGNASTWEDVQRRGIDAFKKSMQQQIKNSDLSDADKGALIDALDTKLAGYVENALKTATNPADAYKFWSAADPKEDGTGPDDGFLQPGKIWDSNSPLLQEFLAAGSVATAAAAAGKAEADKVLTPSAQTIKDISDILKAAINDNVPTVADFNDTNEVATAKNTWIDAIMAKATVPPFTDADKNTLAQSLDTAWGTDPNNAIGLALKVTAFENAVTAAETNGKEIYNAALAQDQQNAYNDAAGGDVNKLNEFWADKRETQQQKLKYAWGQAAIYNLANDPATLEEQFGMALDPISDTIKTVKLEGADAAAKAEDMFTQALKDMHDKVGNMDFAGHTVETQEDAQHALEAINNAIVEKDKIRAHLGATQNRLENTVSNLNIQAENLQAAESRISDVDVATEMTQFVRNQILTQSAVAMLSQANSLPQMAMQLIGG